VDITPESSLASDVLVASSKGMSTNDSSSHSPLFGRPTHGSEEVVHKHGLDRSTTTLSEAAKVGTGQLVSVLFAGVGSDSAKLELSQELAEKEVGVELILCGIVRRESSHDGLRHDNGVVSQRNQMAASLIRLKDIKVFQTFLETSVGGIKQIDTPISSSEGFTTRPHSEVHEVVAGESDEAGSESSSGKRIILVLDLVG